MIINYLKLKDFRNAEDSEIMFDGGVNIICGANAAGKTNILESVFYFASGKSFRNCKDRELVRFGCDSAYMEMGFTSGKFQRKMSATLKKGSKRIIRIGESQPLKLSEYIGKFRCVIFTPDHLSLVKGAPENRRKFLDLAICQSFPRYAATISEYNRVLAQKNALLKRGNVIDELLDIYNERLSQLCAVVTVNRRKYISKLEIEAQNFLLDMSNKKEVLTLNYSSQAGEAETQEEIKEKYRKLFLDKMETEKERFLSVYGVHKDDFNVYINKKSVRMYGSQGQQRSTVLSLKLAEGELSKNLTGEYPVFLLDDILSELDCDRKDYILSRITDRQVIITGCDSDAFESESGKRIFVNEGKIRY